jgi:hypothetical protein
LKQNQVPLDCLLPKDLQFKKIQPFYRATRPTQENQLNRNAIIIAIHKEETFVIKHLVDALILTLLIIVFVTKLFYLSGISSKF